MIYLDYAATTPMLPSVKKALFESIDKFYANASALHAPGHLASNEIEKARTKVAKLINANPNEIIFTSSATESNNTVIHIFAGQPVYISPYEHHSLIGARPATANSSDQTPEKCVLASHMLASNELGDIFDLPHGDFYLHSDLTQCIGKMPIDVKALNLDYATFSAHKIGGPIGVAALYIKNGAPFKPFIIGGSQENHRRGGTYNTPAIIGFGVACEHCLKRQTWQEYESKIRPLRDYFAKQLLNNVPGTVINTDINNSLPNILNASFKGAEGESVQLMLDDRGIIVSTGSACASGEPSHVIIAKTGDPKLASSSIRFSLSLNTTKEELDYTVTVLSDIIKKLQGFTVDE